MVFNPPLLPQRQYNEQESVVVILIDFVLQNDPFTCMEKFERKLSTKQSISNLIEKQIEKMNLFNMYLPRDMEMVFSNISSKYLQIIHCELLRSRNSQLAAKEIEDSERKLLNVMEIPFFKRLEKWFDGFDWTEALPVLTQLSNHFHCPIQEFKNDEFFAKLLLSSCVKSYFMQFIHISKRHARSDKVPYYRFSLYFVYSEHEHVVEECFNSNLETKYLAQRNEYPLKVIILMGKHTLEWTENGFVQVEELNYSSELENGCCFRKNFLISRKSSEISYYMNKLIEFNCKWNASLFYNAESCNTGHYAKSLMSYLNVSLSNRDTNVLLDCICENRHVPLEMNVPIDLIMVSSFARSISTYLNGIGYEPKWFNTISNILTKETSEETFFLKLDSSWSEIETFYSFLLPYLSLDCPFLDVSEEFSLFLLALLESNREIIRGEAFSPLVTFTKNQILELMRRKRNLSFHAQLYNFSDYNTMKKTIITNDVNILKDISLYLQQ